MQNAFVRLLPIHFWHSKIFFRTNNQSFCKIALNSIVDIDDTILCHAKRKHAYKFINKNRISTP